MASASHSGARAPPGPRRVGLPPPSPPYAQEVSGLKVTVQCGVIDVLKLTADRCADLIIRFFLISIIFF